MHQHVRVHSCMNDVRFKSISDERGVGAEESVFDGSEHGVKVKTWIAILHRSLITVDINCRNPASTERPDHHGGGGPERIREFFPDSHGPNLTGWCRSR